MKKVSDAQIQAGNTLLKSISANFTPNDIGKIIHLEGAGAGGVYLSTKIAVFVSPVQVILDTPAITGVMSADITWGTDNTFAIQSCIDTLLVGSGGIVLFPPGTYAITRKLKLGDGVIFQGAGPNSTIIKSNLTTPVIQSKNITQRYNFFQLRDLQIDNTRRTNVGSIGIDLTKVSLSTLRDVLIKNVETGILCSGESYYNNFFNPVIFDARTGIKIVNGANENRIFSGRIQDVKLGINLDDVSNPQIYGICIERFGIGIQIGPKAVSHPKIIGSRLENTPLSGIGIMIAQSTLASFIVGPYFQGLVTNIKDLAKDSNVIADQHWQIGSNTTIKRHIRISETINMISIAKQSAIDHMVQFNVDSDLENYSIYVTCPSNIPTGLVVMGIPNSVGVKIRITNIMTEDIQLTDSKFIIDLWRH